MPSYSRKKIFSSFTLIELLVVVAIILVVSLAVIPQFVGLGGNRKLDADVELFVSALNSARTKATTNVIMRLGTEIYNNCDSGFTGSDEAEDWAWSVRVCPESQKNVRHGIAYDSLITNLVNQPSEIQTYFNQKAILLGMTHKSKNPSIVNDETYCEYPLEAIYLKDSYFNCTDGDLDNEIVFDRITGNLVFINGLETDHTDIEICNTPTCNDETRIVTIGDRGNVSVETPP